MESSKISALLFISMLFLSTVTPILGCSYCPKPPKKHTPKGGGVLPPVPKLPVPPVTVPKLPVPPVTVPPVTVPKLPLPPVVGGGGGLPIPPVVGGGGGLPIPPVVGGGGGLPIPPVVGGGGGLPIPPVVGGGGGLPIPPVVGGGGGLPVPPVIGGGGKPPKGGCPPPKSPPKTETCPIDTLKLGACVDLLGGLVHIGLGDPAKNKCCPLLQGLAEIEAAACLCTTIKVKALNLKLYVPLALQLLITCGKSPPPGFTCSV